MRIAIATTQVPFVRGGAEIHAESLLQALREAGHQAEIVAIPFKWYPPEQIMDHLLACRLLDLSESCGDRIDRVIGLKFPAYHIQHPHKTLWVLHQYRSAFDLWGLDDCDLAHFPHGREVCEAIRTTEDHLLNEARGLYANSKNVADRLQRFCQREAEPLYHPPRGADKFYHREAEDFLYFPSRLNALKRQSLVVKALAHTKEPVKVHFAGAPEGPEIMQQLIELAERCRVSDRIVWHGRVTDEAMLEGYARCRGVLFTPVDEDYGYITLEACLSHKPVITCTDSGGPLEFVRHRENGWVADPTPESLAQGMDYLWREKAWAAEAGQKAHQTYLDLNINWPHVISKLLA
ncbi:MAG: glycosyltransferase family 4 protein [Verrucomicrobiota bacterium JB022]|nr:glycosyltransferase family 4 protein [Verrucomicrobiota bacterium JB022]